MQQTSSDTYNIVSYPPAVLILLSIYVIWYTSRNMFPNSPTCTMELHAYGIQYDAVRALASVRVIVESMYVHCRPNVMFFSP